MASNGSLADITLGDIAKGLRRYQPFLLAVASIVLVAVFLPGKTTTRAGHREAVAALLTTTKTNAGRDGGGLTTTTMTIGRDGGAGEVVWNDGTRVAARTRSRVSSAGLCCSGLALCFWASACWSGE